MQTLTTNQQSTNPTSIKESLLELVWPTRCVGCETLGQLLCDNCKDILKAIDVYKACPRCGAPYGQIICTECYSRKGPEKFSFSQAVCALEFESVCARMVVLYKNQNEHRLAQIMAERLYTAIPKRWLKWADCISWIPVDRKTLRRRGFDQMQPVAAELARITSKPALDLLTKKPVKDQRELDRQQRRKNLQGSFDCKAGSARLPSHIILIDDVLTTGATLDIAAETLLDGGAQEVRVAAFARVW
jgi:ComF family protein